MINATAYGLKKRNKNKKNKILCSRNTLKTGMISVSLGIREGEIDRNRLKERRRWREMEVKTAAVNDRFWHVLCCANKHFFYKSRLVWVGSCAIVFFVFSFLFIREREGRERERTIVSSAFPFVCFGCSGIFPLFSVAYLKHQRKITGRFTCLVVVALPGIW